MELVEVVFDGKLVRNSEFHYTLEPSSSTPFSLCYALGGKYLKQAIENPAISGVITTEENAALIPSSKGLIITNDPQALYYKIHDFIIKSGTAMLLKESHISSKATIHSSVCINGTVWIEEDVVIEKGVIIEPNSIIRKGTYIGNRVIVGARGMQNLRINNKFIRIEYGGGVDIGESVEVLDMAIIQRPYNFKYTKINRDSKISLRVNLGHGSTVGINTMIAGNAQVAGNVFIGNDVWIGPSVVIADGLHIGDNSKILLGSVVATDVRPGEVVSGNFALDHKKQLKSFARTKKL